MIKDELQTETTSWRPVYSAALAVALLIAAGLKWWLAASGRVPFNADEAIVALMARHILGGSRPVFFYGQAYMGSLDAFLVAGVFRLFGEQVWGIRLVQSGLFLLTLTTTVWLGRVALGSWRVGLLAAWLLAVPPVNVSLYTTASLGNYGEALLLGNLILIAGLRIVSIVEGGRPVPWWLWWFWGLFTGIGIWAFGLTLVYAFPSALAIAWRLLLNPDRPRFSIKALGKGGGFAGFGVVFGAFPWILFAFQNGFGDLVAELTGGAIAGVEGAAGLQQMTAHLVNLLVLGSTAVVGLRPPWEVRWLAWPVLPLVLVFWLGVLVFAFWRICRVSKNRVGALVLAGVVITLAAGFIFTPFGADPSGRYFLPIYVVLALFGAELIQVSRRRFGHWALGAVLVVIIFNFWGTVQSANRMPPGITTQFDPVAQVDHRELPTLIDFLQSQGETRGFSNYWVAYPLAFISEETLVFTPRLPYHQDFRYTDRDDRYAPYRSLVADTEQVAYITTNHPDLDAHLRLALEDLGVTWLEAEIGDYHVFYKLSKRVLPIEMGLGETTP